MSRTVQSKQSQFSAPTLFDQALTLITLILPVALGSIFFAVAVFLLCAAVILAFVSGWTMGVLLVVGSGLFFFLLCGLCAFVFQKTMRNVVFY